MSEDRRITFFHAPNSRSGCTRALLEELGASYELRALNLNRNEQRDEAYLRINPMGKVPAILHQGALITEQPAVFIYLADLFPEARLAPPIGDPLRGPYLRWMVFYGSCFEPALIDRSQQNTPPPRSRCPYGDFDTMWGTLTSQLEKGPYLLGETFTAADVLWGMALNWTTGFGLVPASNTVKAYTERVMSRPAIQRSAALDAELAASQA